MPKFIATTKIGSHYGKALSLKKKGDVPGAFKASSKALGMVCELERLDPLTIPLRVSVTVLFAQLGIQLGRPAEARDAAVETLRLYGEIESRIAPDESLQQEVQKLRYYAEYPSE